MEQTQTATDYKEYFKQKFITIFINLINKIYNILPDESDDKKNILKIINLGDKLNFDKIIKKMEENKKLIDIINLLLKNNLNDENYYNYFKNKEKYWTILPSFNINTIILQISDKNIHIDLFTEINNLYVCAVTYSKVLEQINDCANGKEFNPFESIGNMATNMDIETLFKDVKVKNLTAYEMIMDQLINKETTEKMQDYISNIKESDVNEAASKLNDVINSDQFQGNKQTSQILSEMLTKIKKEVIDLKDNSDSSKMQGKQGMEQLLNIAQKVAGNMMNQIKESDISVLDIWDATSSLAKNTVQSDALNIVDNLIRSNIVNNLNNQNNKVNTENTENTSNIEDTNYDAETDSELKVKKSRRNRNRNKNN